MIIRTCLNLFIILNIFVPGLFCQTKIDSLNDCLVEIPVKNLFETERVIRAEKDYLKIVLKMLYIEPTDPGRQQISEKLGEQFYLEFDVNGDTLYSKKGITYKQPSKINLPSSPSKLYEWIDYIIFDIKIYKNPDCKITYKVVKQRSKEIASAINCKKKNTRTFSTDISFQCYNRIFKNKKMRIKTNIIDSKFILSYVELPKIFGMNIYALESNKVHTLKRTNNYNQISVMLKKKLFLRYPFKMLNWIPASIFAGQLFYKSYSEDYVIDDKNKVKVLGTAFVLSLLPVYRIIECLILSTSSERSVNDPWLDDRFDIFFNLAALSIIASDYFDNGKFDFFGQLKKLPPIIKSPPPLPTQSLSLKISFNF